MRIINKLLLAFLLVITYHFSFGQCPTPTISSSTGAFTLCPSSTLTLTGSPSGGTWGTSTSVASINSTTGLVTALSSGTMAATYSETTTCGVLTASVMVTVEPVPVLTVSGTSTICAGGYATIIFYTTSGGTVTCSPYGSYPLGVGTFYGEILPSPTASTTFTATISNGYCSAPATGSCVVNVMPTPTVTVAPGQPLQICSGSTSGCVPIIGTPNAVVTYAGQDNGSGTGHITIPPSGETCIPVTGTTGSTPSSFVLSLTGITGPGGCPGSTAITYTVTVIPVPPPVTIIGTTSICAGSTSTLTVTPSAGAHGTWSSGTTSVATIGSSTGVMGGITAGTSVISYTQTNGMCATTNTVTATVIATPPPVTIAGTTSICTTGTSTLTVTPSTGYIGTWSSGTTSVATIGSGTGVMGGITAGTSVISYTQTNGMCVTTNTVTATVNPTPDPTITSTVSAVCGAETATLTVAPGVGSGTYTWSASPSSAVSISSETLTSADITEASGSSGTVTITYSVTAAGCSGHTSFTVTAAPQPYVCVTNETPGSEPFTIICEPPASPSVSVTYEEGSYVEGIGIVPGYTCTATFSGSSYNVPAPYYQAIEILSYSIGGCTWNYPNCQDSLNTLYGRMESNAGINNTANATNEFTVIPNPNQGTFSLSGTCSANVTKARLEIVNLTGQTVYTDYITANNGILEKKISLGSEIPNGFYVLKIINNENQVQAIQFVLEH